MPRELVVEENQKFEELGRNELSLGHIGSKGHVRTDCSRERVVGQRRRERWRCMSNARAKVEEPGY
jgi:hypothetical protein